MKILGEDLARVTGNVMKFVNPKSLYLPGEVLFDLTNNTLRCYACDDYIALTDSASAKEINNDYFVLKVEDVKDLEAFARANKKYEVECKIHDSGHVRFVVGSDDEEDQTDHREYETMRYTEENWNLVEMILFGPVEDDDLHIAGIRPERLAKLSTLKHHKDAPIVLKVVKASHQLIRFKIGETLRGVIMPVNLADVRPEFLWENDG